MGSGTVLVDDPLLTAREIHRARPLIRVVFDRRLRVPPTARVFSTLEAGPVIIMTTPESIAKNRERTRELEDAGALLEPIPGGDLRQAFTRLANREITSVVLEGGVALQRAAWTERLVDAVHIYIAPITIGPQGVSWLDANTVPVVSLADRRMTPCGPDVFIEGYVHGID